MYDDEFEKGDVAEKLNDASLMETTITTAEQYMQNYVRVAIRYVQNYVTMM